ncbi:MAG: glycosyltransferase family 4 protein [Oligoflexales bacterium]|nr:glycosyltransferase family 4 protein [Oligoflexales bacterium]
MVSTLVKIDRENEYYIFTGPEQLGCEEWKHPNVHIITSDIKGGETFKNLLWEQIKLPQLASQYRIDILHSPANMSPLFFYGKSIVHIHDLCFVVNPQWYRFSFRTWYRFVIPRLVRKATHVVTNSNNSRNDLMQFFKLDPSHVSMVYWAVDEVFFSKTASFKIDEQADLNALIRDGYILYVGSLEPRKNIEVLIEAFVKLRKKQKNLAVKLVLIGGSNSLFSKIHLPVEEEFKEDIIIKGFVDENTLRVFYKHAKLVAYPSLYEGFGFPPLEAMASGTAVVTSNSSSIPEIVGDAALQVDPSDSNALSEAMEEIITHPDLRAALIEKGYQQVKKFNWNRVARNILALYHKVYYSEDIPYEKWESLLKVTKSDQILN